jgi:hypothetical protein
MTTRNKKGMPPRADISPGGRALRAAKSKIKDFKSVLQRMIEAAQVKGNEREVHCLEGVNERLPDDADVNRYSAKRLNDLYDGAMLAAHPSLRKLQQAINRTRTAPAREQRQTATPTAALRTAVQDEISEKGLTPSSGMQFANSIYEEVRKRLAVEKESRWPTSAQIRYQVRAILRK